MAFGGSSFLDDLDTDPMKSGANVVDFPAERIRKEAHIANGGDASFECPKCHGTGIYRGYARSFPCFKCNRTGRVSRGVASAAKAAQTRHINDEAFADEHAGIISGLREIASWHEFAASLIAQFDARGRLTDRQIDAARSALARVAERREQKRAERNAEAVKRGGTIGVEAINALFATAIGNGLSRPIFRTECLTIKPAKRHAGVLYVTDKRVEDYEGGRGGAYVGKIVDGQFHARREAMADTLSILCEIATDPAKAATEYGRSTGTCGCCGRELSDPASVAAGIGPICAEKWGL